MSRIQRYSIVKYLTEPQKDSTGELVLYSDHLAAVATLEAQLADARKFPDDDHARPQLVPPTSPNDEARRWAEYADWLERSYVAQNLARGETERQLRELQEDVSAALGDLRECAASLGIELLTGGLDDLRGAVHGLTLAVAGKVRDARRDAMEECLEIDSSRPHDLGEDDHIVYLRAWRDYRVAIRAKPEEEKDG